MENTASKVTQLLQSTPVVPDYESKWSSYGKRMRHQTLRALVNTTFAKRTIHLDVGQPNPDTTLISDIKVTLNDGSEVSVDSSITKSLGLYGPTAGIPALRKWLTELQRREHKPPMLMSPNHPVKFDLILCCGITDALGSVLKVILNTDFTDTVLMEEIAYMSFRAALGMHGCNVQGLPFDDKGIIPQAMEDMLANWNTTHPKKPLPKFLYVVASASNPRGYNWDENRKAEIYLICRKYDVLIVDDAAYYFLQFGKRPRSFQELDVDGRVIRMDTFSKILGAGYRLGWTSGAFPIMEKILINHEITTVHASMATQAIIYSILNSWGPERFNEHVSTVSSFYQKRAECLMAAFQKHLTGLATWTVPKGGMFTWLTIQGVEDTKGWVNLFHTEDFDVSVVEGFHFKTEPGMSNCFRVCFTRADEKDMDLAMKCIADTIRKIKKDGKTSLNGN